MQVSVLLLLLALFPSSADPAAWEQSDLCGTSEHTKACSLLAHSPQPIKIAGIEVSETTSSNAAETKHAVASDMSVAVALKAQAAMDALSFTAASAMQQVVSATGGALAAVTGTGVEQEIEQQPIQGGNADISTTLPEEEKHTPLWWLAKQKPKVPISGPLWCVVALSVQPLLVFTLLTIVRNTDVVHHGSLEHSWHAQWLSSAFENCTSAPALSAFFLACGQYMQCAGSMLKGRILDMQGCVLVVTVVATLELLCVLILPFTAKREKKEGKESAYFVTLSGQHCEVAETYRQRILALHVFFLITFYGGLMVIVVRSLQMVSSSCTLPFCATGLLSLYFIVHFLLWCARHVANSSPSTEGALLAAGARVYKVPMMAVLLIAAQMQMAKGRRAQGIEVEGLYFGGTEQQWIYVGSYALFIAILFEVIMSAARGWSRAKRGDCDIRKDLGDASAIELAHLGRGEPLEMTFLTVGQYTLDAVGYGSLIAIVAASFLHSGAGIPSTSVRAACLLAFIFFGVRMGEHVVLWGLAILTDVQGSLHAVVKAAAAAVKVCPHLCVLFLVCQLRAEEQAQDVKNGNPQWWAEDAMILCVSGVGLQQLCCLTLPAYTGVSSMVEDDNSVVFDRRPFVGAYVVTMVRYTALLMLHAGLQCVCVSIFAITPATAHLIRAARPLMPLVFMVLVFALVAACLSSVKVISSVVKFTLESVDKNVLGPHLGVSVRVTRVWLNLCSGYVNIGGITVTSPPIPELMVPQQLKVERIVAVINRGRLLRTRFKECEIESLTMKGVDVTFDTMPSFKGEISAFMARFEETFQTTIVTSQTNEGGSSKGQQQGPMRYIIHELAVRDITTEVKSPPMRMELRDIVYDDFHAQCRPMSLMDDVFRSVVLALLRHVAMKSRGMWYGVVDCGRQMAIGVATKLATTASQCCGSSSQG